GPVAARPTLSPCLSPEHPGSYHGLRANLPCLFSRIAHFGHGQSLRLFQNATPLLQGRQRVDAVSAEPESSGAESSAQRTSNPRTAWRAGSDRRPWRRAAVL